MLGPQPLKAEEPLERSSERRAAHGCTRVWSSNSLNSFEIKVVSVVLSPPAPACYSLVKKRVDPDKLNLCASLRARNVAGLAPV